MLKEKLFIADIDGSKKLVTDEMYDIITEGKDSRVLYDGWSIIVKAENKEEIEKEYNIALQPLKPYLRKMMREHQEVTDVINTIQKENEELFIHWENYTFGDMLQYSIINSTLNKLYDLPEEEMINTILHSNYFDLMYDDVKKKMIDLTIKDFKKKIKELTEMKKVQE